MTKTNTLKILVALLLVLNTVIIGMLLLGRNHGGKKHNEKRTPHMERFIKETFDFDKSQMDRFSNSRDKHNSAVRALKDQLYGLSHSYYKSQTPDSTRDSLLLQITELTTSIYSTNQLHFDEVRQLCTPEQEEQMSLFIDNLLNTSRDQHPKRRGPHPPRH